MSALTAAPLFFVKIIRVAICRRRPIEIIGFTGLAMLCLIAALAIDGAAELFGLPAEIFAENGPVESFQAILIGGAGLLFFVAALRFDFEIFYASAVLALLSALAVLRELPGCASLFYESGACLSDAAKDISTIMAFGILIALFAWRRIPLAKQLGELNMFWIVPAAYAGALLVIGETMEHFHAVGLEETMETAAYLVLLCFAGLINARPDWFDARLEAFD